VAIALSPLPRTLRLALGAFAGLLLLAALWAGWWWLVARTATGALAQWAAEETRQGGEVVLEGPAVDGFPWRVRGRFGAVVWHRTDGIHWRAAALEVEAPLWQPNALTLRLTGAQELRLPAPDGPGPLLIEAGGGHGRLRLGGAGGFTDAALSLERLTLGTLRLEALELGVSQPATPPAGHTELGLMIQADARRLGLPPGLTLSLGPAVESAQVALRVMGPVPRPVPAGLSAWSRDGGTVELDSATLAWGPLRLAAEGTLALDRDLQPQGALSAEITGFAPALDALAAAGLIRPKDAGTAKAVLGGLTQKGANGSGGAPPRIPVSMHDRALYIGPFRLMPLPLLVWQPVGAG
jgi:hypothetical protein